MSELNESIICTFFSGSHHYGVAALVNSLYKQGFRGNIYAGYKGNLPSWAGNITDEHTINGKRIKTLVIAENLQIHFVAIDEDYHLANYKPNFMIEVWDFPLSKNANGIFFFDPDITVKIKWSYFEEWISYGVALVHEVSNNDMPPSHPKRRGWEQVIKKAGKTTSNKLTSYINAGFCGVKRADKEFLYIWKDIFKIGVEHFGLSNNQWDTTYTQDHIFFKADQDALNIAAMCSSVPLSEMGPEAMDFVSGGYVMSHLVGTPKPWQKNIFLEFLSGKRLTLPDKLFWENVSAPLKPYNNLLIANKKASIKITSFLSRFYSK